MRERRVPRMAASLVLCGSVACVGGGGALPEGLSGSEPAPGSVESVSSSSEGAPASGEVASPSRDDIGTSAEPGPGAQGIGGSGAGGTFQCVGTFVCREAGKTKSNTLTLTSANGGCLSDGALLEPDGIITLKGAAVGTWAPTGTGFVVTVQKDVVVCTRAEGS